MFDRLASPAGRSIASTVIAVVPIAAAALRAVFTDWVPIGDSAYFTLRSLDVATAHHPLLGAWSSGSTDVDRDVNNLGPLQLDLLAPFTKIAPFAGTAVGVAVVHIVSVVAIAWVVRRVGGDRLVPPMMAAVALMTWVMGSEMLITPRQHQYLLIPFLLVITSAWAATSGDRWALVPLVAAGSLVAQTHLSYPILLVGLLVPVVVGQVLAARRSPETPLRTWRRPLLVSGALVVVLWIQPLIDQLWGWGNAGAVLRSSGDTEAAGVATGVRIVADVLAGRAGYSRPGYGVFDPNARVASGLQVAIFALVLTGIVVGLALAIRRLGRSSTTAWFGVASALLIAAIVNATQLPETIFGFNAFNYRWLWPIASWLVFGLLVGVVSVAERTSRPALGPGVSAAVLVGLTIANLPESIQTVEPAQHAEWRRLVAELTDQLADVELIDPVVIDQSHLFFGHPYAYPVGIVLRERGLDYRYEGAEQWRRFGESRVADGTEPTRLVIWHGDAAAQRWNDADVVVSVGGVAPLVVVREERP